MALQAVGADRLTERQHQVLANTLDHLVEMIRKKRQKKGLSLREAAAEIGIPFSTLNHIERGVSPKLSTVRLIIDWLAA